MRRILPREDLSGVSRYVINEEIRRNTPLSLLADGRAAVTILLWIAFKIFAHAADPVDLQAKNRTVGSPFAKGFLVRYVVENRKILPPQTRSPFSRGGFFMDYSGG